MKESSFSQEFLMQRCLQLAENGRLLSMPNPSVGALIVYQDRIIGEGHTSGYGGPHAEVNAFRSIEENDLPLLPFSTLYVILEPCSHFGKTPPCVDLIIKNKIKKVVIGTRDSHHLVGGNGIQKLQDAGIKTIVGVLEKECQWSLRKFLVPIEKQRPYITLKWAESSNGKVAVNTGEAVKITSSTTQVLTHQLRAEHQGILCGWKTVFFDQPALNNRLWTGKSPQVIVIDLNQKLNNNQYFNSKENWWRIVNGESNRVNDIIVTENTLKDILIILLQKGIQSIFVEGGSHTLQHFIDLQLWDECYVYQGEISIENGLDAPTLKNQQLRQQFKLEKDHIRIYQPNLNE
jgi:diaminohydroxyphosphoribosylaminopyrimidine deaminase/5-amino-6-(5-phosphoribosylamino)uracil reductase